MIHITKIYLVTNCFGNPFKVYIGKTKSSRKSAHKTKFGFQIGYSYIDEVNSLKYEDWEPLETFWINYFKFLGFEVVNKRKKGGSGPEFCSEEHKRKISESNKGKKKPEGFGERHSLKTKGKPKPYRTKEHNDKISKSMIGKKIHSEEQKLKFSKQRKGKAAFKAKSVIQYDKQDNFIKEWSGTPEAANNLKIDKSNINACCLGIQKTSGGFKWKYKNEKDKD